ncbi:MAG: multifunctional CCA tRNA nucleotidyl transferase/2'3'-cyclic phosphodiesterase/2'nucleotidase/phosphatase [Betaproteobacteria bacterium]
MKIYQVGGSVRDGLLGLPVTDRDYVVVGSTPDEMRQLGFQPVGRDFPVFLHPQTHEEYALARTERKQGRGHQGFVIHADPAVTLEEDLLRRDLTINAMACDEQGSLIDPHGGQRDLGAGILRHVSPAFSEDPLRVLRVARFAARFGFAVAEDTEALMRDLVERGELRDLSPERVWQEIARGLVERAPSRMLTVLRRCGALAAIAPEVDRLFAQALPGRQPDSGVDTLEALDRRATRLPKPAVAVQFAIAARHLPAADALALATRLRAPLECRDAAVNAARHTPLLRRARNPGASDWLDLLVALDALRRPERLAMLIEVGGAYESSEAATKDFEHAAALWTGALSALSRISYRQLEGSGDADVAERVRQLRLSALEDWLRELPSQPPH